MWHLEQDRAILDLPPLAATIEMEHPEAGLGGVRLDGQSLQDAALFRIGSWTGDSLGRQICQRVHVRGSDLVASYQSTAPPEISTEIYWRAIPVEPPASAGVELIVSVQTDLLDSDPRMSVGSRVPTLAVYQIVDSEPATLLHHVEPEASTAWTAIRAGALLYRLPEMPFSYLEMVHPSDWCRVELARAGSPRGELTSRFGLFDEPLERGVIRRGRVRGLVLPRHGDEHAAVTCYRQFLQSAIPLTA